MPRLLLAVLAAALIAFAAAVPAAAAPALKLSPTSGARGSAATASGAGFSARARGTLRFGARRVATFRTDRFGAFSASFTVPADAAAGLATVAATAGSTASATYDVVVPAPPTPPEAGSRWIPAPNTTWQIQFTGIFDWTVDVQAYDIDGFDHDKAVVDRLHADGRKVICYFSAGSWEDWRPDAGDFPEAILGKGNGWPGERFVDIRRLDVLGPIMTRRMDMCAAKGFDAVDPDNVDAYKADSGFPLTAADQLAYNRFLAREAHARGLSVGLKNDLSQVAELEPDFDFAINESCFTYRECGLLDPFVKAGKAVFGIQYDTDPAAFCPGARAAGHMTIAKNWSLDAWRVSC